MAGVTYSDVYDPWGLDEANGVAPPRPSRPAPKPSFDQFYHTWWAQHRARDAANNAAARQRAAAIEAAKPKVVAYVPTPPANWRPAVPTGPKPQPQAASQPKPQPSMPRTPSPSSGYESPKQDQRPAAAPRVAQQQEGPSMFGQLHAQHFGQHGNMIQGVNQAMSSAANQWSEAAARNQSLNAQREANNQTAMMEQQRIAATERMNAAEMADRKEKRAALMQMAGFGGRSLLGRSLLG